MWLVGTQASVPLGGFATSPCAVYLVVSGWSVTEGFLEDQIVKGGCSWTLAWWWEDNTMHDIQMLESLGDLRSPRNASVIWWLWGSREGQNEFEEVRSGGWTYYLWTYYIKSLKRREDTLLYRHIFSDDLIYFCLEKWVMFPKYRQVLWWKNTNCICFL